MNPIEPEEIWAVFDRALPEEVPVEVSLDAIHEDRRSVRTRRIAAGVGAVAAVVSICGVVVLWHRSSTPPTLASGTACEGRWAVVKPSDGNAVAIYPRTPEQGSRMCEAILPVLQADFSGADIKPASADRALGPAAKRLGIEADALMAGAFWITTSAGAALVTIDRPDRPTAVVTNDASCNDRGEIIRNGFVMGDCRSIPAPHGYSAVIMSHVETSIQVAYGPRDLLHPTDSPPFWWLGTMSGNGLEVSVYVGGGGISVPMISTLLGDARFAQTVLEGG